MYINKEVKSKRYFIWFIYFIDLNCHTYTSIITKMLLAITTYDQQID